MVGDNIQDLSFRTFQQLKLLVVNSILETSNIVVCFLVLFVIVACSCTMHFLIRRYDWRYVDESYLRKAGQKVPTFLTVLILFRVLNGFGHAYLDQPHMQVVCLLASSLISFTMVASYYSIYKRQNHYTLQVVILGAKVLIGAVLLVEASQAFNYNTLKQTGSGL